MSSWAEICRGSAMVSVPPFLDRTKSRNTRVKLEIPPPPPPSSETNGNAGTEPTLREKVFKFFESAIDKIKSRLNSPEGSKPFSTFQSLSVHIWRHVTVARNLRPEDITVFTIFADCRKRVDPPMPESYFGNLILRVNLPEVSHLGWGRWYTLRELEAATNGLCAENVIGEDVRGKILIPTFKNLGKKFPMGKRGENYVKKESFGTESSNWDPFPAWAKEVRECEEKFQVDRARGLSSEQVEKQRKIYGWNELEKHEGASIFKFILEQFNDTLVRILLATAVISFVLAWYDGEEGGEMEITAFVEPLVIFLILIVNAIVGIWQESNAEKALEALEAN